MDEPANPTQEQVESYLVERSNWGRWGDDDQRGTVNLNDAASRVRAASAVRTGATVSLSRTVPTWTGAGNSLPAQHFMKMANDGGQNSVRTGPDVPGGWAWDYYGLAYHGVTTTHLDAICHVWGADGMYNGRDPRSGITFDGATFGGVEQWAEGIFTRAVILDVPHHRGVAHVEQDQPVHGWELEEIVAKRNLTINPGDAVCIYSGRESWQRANPERPYGRYPIVTDPSCTHRGFEKPGLHASCLPFLRDHDVSALVWDMLDVMPSEYDVPFTVHGAIHAYGLAVIDNALLEPVATEMRAQDRDDFLLVVSPLVVQGGTGSPVNPLAVL